MGHERNNNKKDAALGANSTIRCGVTIGEWTMIGSGNVVTKDISALGLVFGNLAKLRGLYALAGWNWKKSAKESS